MSGPQIEARLGLTETDLEVAWAHCSVAFRLLVMQHHSTLEADARRLLDDGFDPIDLTVVECRACGRCWVASLAADYPHDCQPQPGYSRFVTVPAFRPDYTD